MWIAGKWLDVFCRKWHKRLLFFRWRAASLLPTQYLSQPVKRQHHLVSHAKTSIAQSGSAVRKRGAFNSQSPDLRYSFTAFQTSWLAATTSSRIRAYTIQAASNWNISQKTLTFLLNWKAISCLCFCTSKVFTQQLGGGGDKQRARAGHIGQPGLLKVLIWWWNFVMMALSDTFIHFQRL